MSSRRRKPPPDPPSETPTARALRVARTGVRLRDQHDAWVRERLEVAAQLHRDGLSQQDIAALLQVSKPRAGQLVNEARAAGLLDDDADQERHRATA